MDEMHNYYKAIFQISRTILNALNFPINEITLCYNKDKCDKMHSLFYDLRNSLYECTECGDGREVLYMYVRPFCWFNFNPSMDT